MHCNGKCHLMKELAKAAEQEKPLSDKKALQKEAEVLFCAAMPAFTFALPLSPAAKTISLHRTDLYSRLDVSPVFRPPLLS